MKKLQILIILDYIHPSLTHIELQSTNRGWPFWVKSWREHTKLVSQPLLPVGPAHYKDPSELSFYSEPSLRAGFPPSLSWLCAGTEWQYHSGWGTQRPCSPWHPEVTSLLSCGLNTSFLKERSNETFVRTRRGTGTVQMAHLTLSVWSLPHLSQ